MSVSVVKSGPYFSSGSISFSQLRTNFKETSSGQVSASELRRNTNVREENPIVPDSTENEQISTGSNLSLSQFRNSIKRYVATQSGTDDNSSYPGEPGFRMGRLDLSGRGIDWSGGGYNGRDGQGGGTTGNLTKNVQKGIKITGTCGSVRPDLPAAQMAPIVQVHNVRIDVTGSILGYGGKGGGQPGSSDPSGENGGTAINFGNVGYNNRILVNGVIWAGGGGGERGKTGNKGADSICYEEQDTGWHCQGNSAGQDKCASGFTVCQTGWRYCCIKQGGGCAVAWWYVKCCKQSTKLGGAGGLGGKGGNGRGYNNLGGSLSGEAGSPGLPGEICPSGNRNGENGQPGERGADGGDWGRPGGGTSNTGNGGSAGRAITSDGGEYELYGDYNNPDRVKGTKY